jgi:hypothetical protein
MMTHETHEDRPVADRPGSHRLLPIVGGGVAVAAVLAHLGGGALVMHVGIPALLVYLGLGGGSAIGIVTVAIMMPLLIFVARHWLRRPSTRSWQRNERT